MTPDGGWGGTDQAALHHTTGNHARYGATRCAYGRTRSKGKQAAAMTTADRSPLRHLYALVPERYGADTPSGCLGVGVQHGRCRHADGRLAHATPRVIPAAGHDD